MSNNSYKSNNHNKFLCNYHIILVCKYRKNLLQTDINNDIQRLTSDYCRKYNVIIKAIQSDVNHLHILIDCNTNINLHKFILYLKQYTTFHIWEIQHKILSKHFWKERTFWTDGYFCCTVGNATLDKIEEYINNQG